MKAPALVKRLTSALIGLGYTEEEAQDMISNEGTASIAQFIDQELAFARQNQAPATTKVIVTPTEDKDMALKCTVDASGKYTKIETVDTGYGVQAAKPLPKVEAEVKPTKVEQAQAPQAGQAEVMYDYNSLPVSLQRLVDDISLHKLPTTEQLPVLHIVGWNADTCQFIHKLTAGQAAANAYMWLYTTAPSDWQNIPCIVVAPTDVALLKRYNTSRGHLSPMLPAQADYQLVFPSVLKTVATIDMQQFTKVVAVAGASPTQAKKVAAKANKPQPEEQALATDTPAKVEPAITDALLQELASATNHMKRVSLVNKIQTALGLPKVAAKCTKVELQPTIDSILKQFSVAVPEQAPKADKVTKAKVAKEPAAKALTKGEIEKLWIEAHIRETGVDAKVAKKAFAALDVNWRSSKERADFCTQQGLV